MYKQNDYIYIRTNYRGWVAQLGMSGPIVNPLRCKVSDVITMLMNGMPVFQVQPNTGKSIELTISNIMDDQKFNAPQLSMEKRHNVGQPLVTNTTKGIIPPVNPINQKPIVSVNQNHVEEEVEAAPVAMSAEVDESASAADTFNNNQKLSRSERKKLRKQQLAAEAAAATQTEEESEITTVNLDEIVEET